MVSIFFTEDHEWLRVECGIATVGISCYAQRQLGDLVFVELPEIDRQVAKGQCVVVIESVKAASDIYAPVDGRIVQVNEILSSEPSLVNQASETDGWLWKMVLTDEQQLSELMDADAYKTFIG